MSLMAILSSFEAEILIDEEKRGEGSKSIGAKACEMLRKSGKLENRPPRGRE